MAMRSRDVPAASALRSALAAIDNAEAIPVSQTSTPTTSPHFAGAAAGLGAGEMQRRSLTGLEICEIVEAEISERRVAAAGYEGGGHSQQAGRLRREAQVLSDFIEGWLAVLCGRAEAELPAASWRILQQPPPPQPILRDLGEPYERQLALLVIGQPEM